MEEAKEHLRMAMRNCAGAEVLAQRLIIRFATGYSLTEGDLGGIAANCRAARLELEAARKLLLIGRQQASILRSRATTSSKRLAVAR